MPTYKLRYFNVRGLAEVARLQFALAGVDYEDVRFTKEEWPAEKPNTPFGQMPVLEIDGKEYCQSRAISRYLARTFGFYGKDDLEALEIDQVLEIGQDTMVSRVKFLHEKDADKKAEFEKELKEVKIPFYLGMYEKLLKDKENGLFVGGKISLADIFVFDLAQKLDMHGLVNWDDFPNVRKCRETVGAEPRIKEWVEKRPETES